MNDIENKQRKKQRCLSRQPASGNNIFYSDPPASRQSIQQPTNEPTNEPSNESANEPTN